MTIRTVLSGKGPEVATIAASAPLSEAVAELARRNIGALVVLESGSVAGIISERDLVGCLHRHGPALLEQKVADAMSAPAVTVEPDTEVLSALALITRRRIRHLPVIEHGQLVGIVSIGDLVKHRIDRMEAESAAMRAYIQGV